MVGYMRQSKSDIFNASTIDDSGGFEPLSDLNHWSSQSDIMGTDMNSDLLTVTDNLQGLLKETELDTVENTLHLDGNLMAGDSINHDPIIGFNEEKALIFTDREEGILDNTNPLDEVVDRDGYQLTGFANNETVTFTEDAMMGTSALATMAGAIEQPLVFSDTETGVLETSDQTRDGRYRDEYILRGVEDQQTVVISLDSGGFNSSLQLVNRETGEIIDQFDFAATEGMARSQLTFTNDNNIEYLVRVTSTRENVTGSYTLRTTLGELTLGLSDQTIQGSITESDQEVDIWTASKSDVYEITHLSSFQTINVTLESSDQTTMLLLFNADTGERISSLIGFHDSNEGIYQATLNHTPREGTDINYGLIVSFFNSDRVGDYTLTVDTGFSLSGGFNSEHERVHPTMDNRFMDNFLVTNLQVGEDVEINVTSPSSDTMVQLFDQDTGTVLHSTKQSDLVFTVEDGINYGVRVVGTEGTMYDLKTNTGFLFDSNPTQLNQTIKNSLATSDATAYFKFFRSNHTYYSDGYYLSGESLSGKDQVTVTIDNTEFLPELHLINAQTGDILESYDTYDHGRDLMSYDLKVEEGMDYLVLVSSLYNRQVGEYTVTVNT